MAKMFYTMDETKAALGKSEDDVKQLIREGKLREFRDGPRLMFKADQVESLKAELSGGSAEDQVGLSAGDTHTPLGLMDSRSGSGSGVISLAGDTSSGSPAPKEDGGAGMDVGLSGSLSGSIGGGSLAGGTLSGTGSMNRGTGKPGVNVFGDEASDVDPMAQTHIAPPKDQISLEGVGSGSGLLDLTRETDDTSLGAALLDEISPGSKRTSPTPASISPSSGSTAGMTSISPLELPSEPVGAPVGTTIVGGPVTVEAPDPVAPAFGAASLAASLVLVLSALVMIRALVVDSPLIDTRIEFLKSANAPFIFLGAGFLLVIILFVIGIFAGKGRQATA